MLRRWEHEYAEVLAVRAVRDSEEDVQVSVKNKDQISIIWTIDDVKECDPEGLLNDDDCRYILRNMKRHHDASIGINWDFIECTIQAYLEMKAIGMYEEEDENEQ